MLLLLIQFPILLICSSVILSKFVPFGKNLLISPFSQHEKFNKILDCKSYFARSYCSNDKGTTENINGLIRRFFPKGTDFDTITEEQIAYVEEIIDR